MKINFILPGISTHPVGGYKIVFEYANRFIALGHQVSVCFYCDINKGRMASLRVPAPSKRIVDRMRCIWHPQWFKLDSRVKKHCVFSIDGDTVPDSDWVFATGVSTARGVASLPSAKGRKAYLIQDFETWETPETEVRSTYHLGMMNIVVSKWLQHIVDEDAFKPCVCIPNPVDISIFRPAESLARNAHAVSLLYHTGAHKGWKYAWEAIQIARESVPDLSLEMFGAYSRPRGMPGWVNYTRDANETELRRIYSSTAAYVCASVNEGFGLTCVEAMACGCALVVSDFPGSREYALPGKNALVSPTENPELMAANIVRILSDLSLRNKLGEAGMETAGNRSWSEAVFKLERLLEQ